MDETKAIAEKIRLMDLAQKLGLILGVNPVWKGGYVIFDNDPVAMVLAIDTGCWKIATGDFGVLNLPQEAPELMAGMSETPPELRGEIKRTKEDGDD